MLMTRNIYKIIVCLESNSGDLGGYGDLEEELDLGSAGVSSSWLSSCQLLTVISRQPDLEISTDCGGRGGEAGGKSEENEGKHLLQAMLLVSIIQDLTRIDQQQISLNISRSLSTAIVPWESSQHDPAPMEPRNIDLEEAKNVEEF